MGRQPWLKPHTDVVLEQLPKSGIRKLLVICPSFVSDCLETLEEIGIRGRESFRAAGGGELTLIPCLNTHPLWIAALDNMVKAWLGGNPLASAACGSNLLHWPNTTPGSR